MILFGSDNAASPYLGASIVLNIPCNGRLTLRFIAHVRKLCLLSASSANSFFAISASFSWMAMVPTCILV